MNIDELEKFVKDNTPRLIKPLTQSQIARIVHFLALVEKELANPGSTSSEFIEAVARKDFYGALNCADDLNQVAIYIYAMYMHDYAMMIPNPMESFKLNAKDIELLMKDTYKNEVTQTITDIIEMCRFFQKTDGSGVRRLDEIVKGEISDDTYHKMKLAVENPDMEYDVVIDTQE